ncbi:MAG: hypothetical protein U0K93_04570 [Acutalibacteraceae bacterium]|nr:hypothetical protein [Acutalibacteraceae bacterium]
MYLHKEYRAGRTIEVIETYPGNCGKNMTRERYNGKGRTPLSMQKYNDKMQYRHLTRLLNTNFMPDDLFITLHYSLHKRPLPEDAKKQLTAFLRKLKRLYKKYGIELKYIKVTAIGSKGAIHHHIVINSGVPYSEITKLWSYSDRTPDYKPLYANGEYSAIEYYLVNQSKVGQGAANKISGKGFVGSRNLKQPEIIKEQYVDKVCWKEPPRAKKGYIIDPDSIDAGVNELNGKPYLFYRMILDTADGQANRIIKNKSRPAEPLSIYGKIIHKKQVHQSHKSNRQTVS